MANEKNLIPLNKRAKSVQREIQSKGGKEKAKRERGKKTIRNILNTFLNDKIQGNAQLEEIAERFGIEISSSKKELFAIVGVLNTLKDCDLNDLEKLMKLLGEDAVDTSGQEESHDELIEAIRKRNENKKTK